MSTHTPTIKTLKNGLRIAVVPDPRALTATALVLVGTGSSFETHKEHGLSHFLEHMCFKGTVRRPSAKMVMEEIESLGAITNAFTDREYTGYFIKGNPAHTDTFVDILSDIYIHSTFPAEEIEKEKGVIIEEINMYEDMPQRKVGELLFETLYPAHATGRSILGTPATVRSFTQKDFIAYKKQFYGAANTVLVFSGNITVAKATALARTHFGSLPRRTRSKKTPLKETQKQMQRRVLHKATDQAHLLIAFRSLPLGHKELPAARLLATVLGRGMSSRLSLIIREELGAAYYVYAQQESYIDHGIFCIGAGIDKRRLAEIITRIMKECERCKDELVSEKELAKAKEYSIGTLRLGLELSDDVAEFFGAQLVLRQKVRTPEQVIASIKKVTAKDIAKVAGKLFTPSGANVAMVGPFSEADIPKEPFTRL